MSNLAIVEEKLPKIINIIKPFISSISLEIKTKEQVLASSSTLIQLKKYIKDLDEDRKRYTDPLRQEIDLITDKYKPLRDELVKTNSILEQAVKNFQLAEDRKALELKRQQEEKERKEREEQEATRFKAEEEVARLLQKSKQVSFEEQVKIDEQIKANVAIAEQAQSLLDSQIPAIIEAPQTKIQTSEGTVYRKVKYIITNLDTIDITKLPYEYLMINKTKLQKAVNAGIKINGVEVKEDFDMVTRKK